MNPKISKKTLTKWRKEALKKEKLVRGTNLITTIELDFLISQERILLLTQELLDQHLIKEK